jgi:hypothetical protein
MFKVPDDSGFLAICVPGVYSGFVDKNWELNQLFRHFCTQMTQQSLLIWGTGREGYWNVEVRLQPLSVHGFREISGPLRVVGGSILVTNYESLTMAAQFDDVRLPEKHEEDQLLSLADGDYCCRIIQMFDPEHQDSGEDGAPDFIIEITQPKALPGVWSKVPWFDDDVYGLAPEGLP